MTKIANYASRLIAEIEQDLLHFSAANLPSDYLQILLNFCHQSTGITCQQVLSTDLEFNVDRLLWICSRNL